MKTDLQHALDQNGCGTQEDWDAIGSMLEKCVNVGVNIDLIRARERVAVAAQKEAAKVVADDRDAVRRKCQTDRKVMGLSVP